MTVEYPTDLQYLDTHEYVRIEDDVATVGITAFAIEQLGDIVFLELAEIDDEVEAEESFGNIESVKAVEELKSPVAGVVIDRNAALIDAPEAIADDPHNDGWLIKVRLSDPTAELNNVMSAADYTAQVEGG
ncbi:MAG: glycine cleavage system protein GcvH [Spirulina sp. SIO3F2]|nr:glycine cleavage system protein GcvH [Spirulina sp. SIO3F2]